jgi:hypothetical protein
MDIATLHQKLIQAARNELVNDRVQYAFEKRIMARLATLPVVDVWTLWSRALWRAAAPCVALTLVLTLWSVYSLNTSPVQQVRAVELEHAVLAPVDVLGDTW